MTYAGSAAGFGRSENPLGYPGRSAQVAEKVRSHGARALVTCGVYNG